MLHNSELRQDLVSGDWIIIAPGRGKRPHEFKNRSVRKALPVEGCPFEDLQKSGSPEPYLIYQRKGQWFLQIVPNRFPAVSHDAAQGVFLKHGPYSVIPGTGHHDLVITRDHEKNFPKLSGGDAYSVFLAFRDRYNTLSQHKYVAYVSAFHNWGPAAGASVYHPHYQIMAVPVIPPDVNHSLRGSARYFEENKKCVHCVMLDWERKEKKRIIFENEAAVAFAPYVSRSQYEIRVFPKKHLPYFEGSDERTLRGVSEALQKALKSLEKNLYDPDYNFFIHTAPIKEKEKYRHYHWHIEVVPKFSIRAGFELSTGLEINVVDPDEAARVLRGET